MMWGYGWGGGLWGLLSMGVFWGLLGLLLYAAVRGWRSPREERPAEGPLRILAERFARGEISREEFEDGGGCWKRRRPETVPLTSRRDGAGPGGSSSRPHGHFGSAVG